MEIYIYMTKRRSAHSASSCDRHSFFNKSLYMVQEVERVVYSWNIDIHPVCFHWYICETYLFYCASFSGLELRYSKPLPCPQHNFLLPWNTIADAAHISRAKSRDSSPWHVTETKTWRASSRLMSTRFSASEMTCSNCAWSNFMKYIWWIWTDAYGRTFCKIFPVYRKQMHAETR